MWNEFLHIFPTFSFLFMLIFVAPYVLYFTDILRIVIMAVITWFVKVMDKFNIEFTFEE